MTIVFDRTKFGAFIDKLLSSTDRNIFNKVNWIWLDIACRQGENANAVTVSGRLREKRREIMDR